MTIPTNKTREEIEHLINYAIKNGYLDEEALEWSYKQKCDYYNYCMAYDPN